MAFSFAFRLVTLAVVMRGGWPSAEWMRVLAGDLALDDPTAE